MHATILCCVLASILSASYPTIALTLSNITADYLDIKFKQQPSSTTTWSSVGDAVYGVVDRKLWLINSILKTSYFDLDNLTLGEISVGAPKSIDKVWSMSFTSTDIHIYYVSKSATSELYQFDTTALWNHVHHAQHDQLHQRDSIRSCRTPVLYREILNYYMTSHP